MRCDERAARLRQGLPRCEDRQDGHRAVAANIDAAMPYASKTERRVATEQQLHQDVTARAWDREAGPRPTGGGEAPR